MHHNPSVRQDETQPVRRPWIIALMIALLVAPAIFSTASVRSLFASGPSAPRSPVQEEERSEEARAEDPASVVLRRQAAGVLHVLPVQSCQRRCRPELQPVTLVDRSERSGLNGCGAILRC
jgi:hypothetical protein